MISKEEEYALGVALTNERIASEIVARIVNSTPYTPTAAQAILDTIDNSQKTKDQIKEYLIVATGDAIIGAEISEQLNLVVEILEYQAAYDTNNDAALADAQSKLSDLSEEAKEYLIVALASTIVANSISSKIDVATQSTSVVLSASTVPTSTVFSNVNFGAANIVEDLPVYTITTWQKLDSTHSTSELFVADVGGDYLGTFQCYLYNGGIYLWHGYSPPQAAQVSVRAPFILDDGWHHFTAVYNGTAETPYIELIVDGNSFGTATVTDHHGLEIDDGFWVGTDPNIWGTEYTLRGKVSNLEIWSEALTEADALALFNAGYNQYPKSLVSKTLIQQFLLGDRELDTDTLTYDEEGNPIMLFASTGAQPTFDSDVPGLVPIISAPPPIVPGSLGNAFPYSTNFPTLEPFEGNYNVPSGIIVNDAFQQKIASPAQPSAPINAIWSNYSYNLVHNSGFTLDMSDYGYVQNFDASKDVVFTFDITELILPVMSGETYSNVRIQAEVWNDSLNGGNFSTDFKNATILENNVSITLTAADMAAPSIPSVAPTTLGTLLSLTFWTHSDGTVVTEGTISIDNLTITND